MNFERKVNRARGSAWRGAVPRRWRLRWGRSASARRSSVSGRRLNSILKEALLVRALTRNDRFGARALLRALLVAHGEDRARLEGVGD